jgi:hypothetical protein
MVRTPPEPYRSHSFDTVIFELVGGIGSPFGSNERR